MASGISAKLPLNSDPDDGIVLNKTYNEVARQNFINLLLTIEGERVMIPSFGIGMKKFLFENDSQSLRSNIHSKIVSQTGKFLPYIKIVKIDFNSYAYNSYIDRNMLSIVITYEIVPLGIIDEISINRNNEDVVIL